MTFYVTVIDSDSIWLTGSVPPEPSRRMLLQVCRIYSITDLYYKVPVLCQALGACIEKKLSCFRLGIQTQLEEGTGDRQTDGTEFSKDREQPLSNSAFIFGPDG